MNYEVVSCRSAILSDRALIVAEGFTERAVGIIDPSET
jgi:hypothetical protein